MRPYFALLGLGLCWLAFKVQVPLKIPVLSSKPAGQFRSVLISRLLIIVLALVPFDAVWSVWPVEASDTRLGLILAAFAYLWGVSVTVVQLPTTTGSLRELRSRLAFGEIGIEEAKDKARCILHGSREEEFLSVKADEAAAELREYISLSNSVINKEDQVIALAERLRAASWTKPCSTKLLRSSATCTGVCWPICATWRGV